MKLRLNMNYRNRVPWFRDKKFPSDEKYFMAMSARALADCARTGLILYKAVDSGALYSTIGYDKVNDKEYVIGAGGIGTAFQDSNYYASGSKEPVHKAGDTVLVDYAQKVHDGYNSWDGKSPSRWVEGRPFLKFACDQYVAEGMGVIESAAFGTSFGGGLLKVAGGHRATYKTLGLWEERYDNYEQDNYLAEMEREELTTWPEDTSEWQTVSTETEWNLYGGDGNYF